MDINKIMPYEYKNSHIVLYSFKPNTNSIGDHAFECSSLNKIDLPDSLVSIGKYAFCRTDLTEITIPDSVINMGEGAFCMNPYLAKAKLSKSAVEIPANMFYECTELRNIDIPSNYQTIGNSAFRDCYLLKSITLNEGLTVIGYQAFQNCVLLNEILLPQTIKLIGESAFENCTCLQSINIPNSIEYICDFAFCECDFKYVVKLNNNQTSFSKDRPTNLTNVESIFDCSKYIEFFKDSFDISKLIHFTPQQFKQLDNFTTFLKSSNLFLTFGFICSLITNNKLDEFIQDTEPKRYKDFDKLISNIYSANINQSKYDMTPCTVFAYNLGCLSKNRALSQKSLVWLEANLTNGIKDLSKFNCGLNFFEMLYNFREWQPLKECPEFTDFVLGKNVAKNISNFDELQEDENWSVFLKRINLEFLDNNPSLQNGGRFRDSTTNKLMFSVYKTITKENGETVTKRKTLKPTVELFKQYFSTHQYSGIENENEKAISNELSKWIGMEQSHFDLAKKIMREFNDNKTPTNLVGSHLQELQSNIKDYIIQTSEIEQEIIKNSSIILNKLNDKINYEFTYDWLEKNDPLNFCLGLYCDCCANLADVGYGIMHASIVHPDVQNLVIKNNKNIPVAKATLYLNKTQGYGVFNTFEVSESILPEQKDKIFNAIMRGVTKLVEEYNKDNLQNPIKKINVGMHVNDLDTIVEKQCEPSEILKCINFNNYGVILKDYAGDWCKDCQYTIWDSNSQNEGELNNE